MKACCVSVAECSLFLCLLLLLAEVATPAPAPASYDYDSVRDLYEALLQRDAVGEPLFSHRLVRKNNRSPSLRLRFGRRSDPAMLQMERGLLGLDNSLDN